MVVYGGDGFGEVWALSFAGIPTWTQILAPTAGSPGGRWGSSAVYDPIRDRMVVFGGGNGDQCGLPPNNSSLCEGTWALAFSGTPMWTQLSPAGRVPLARSGHTAVYDAARDRMVVFGGGTWYFDANNDVRALVWGARPKDDDQHDERPSSRPAAAVGEGRLDWGLSPPRPNPTRGATVIEFDVPRASDLTLSIFDIAGRRVATLAQGLHEPGRYQTSWSGRADQAPLAPGLYMVRLATPAGMFTRALAVLR